MEHIKERELLNPEFFTYQRQFYVKDLLSLKTLINGVSWFEFATFEDFKRTILIERAFDLFQAQKVVIPVSSAEEVSCVLAISPEIRQDLVLYLKDFSEETLAALKPVPQVYIYCDVADIPKFKHGILNYSQDNDYPRDFIFSTQGITKIHINKETLNQLPYLFSDAFNVFPYFCNLLVDWDWNDIEELKIKEIQALTYWARFLHYNVRKRKNEIYLDFFSGHHYVKDFEFNILQLNTSKKLFLKEKTLYLDFFDSEYYLDLATEEYKDANNIDFQTVNSLRMPFDIKLDARYCEFPSFIQVTQNEKCTGNVAQVPYSCKIFSRIFEKGDL